MVRLNSKWDLRRLCKTVQAVALPRMVSIVVDACYLKRSSVDTSVKYTKIISPFPRLLRLQRRWAAVTVFT